MSSGKILVAQGGGPTAVINQSLVGVVLEARRFPQVTQVYGALHGVRGIVNDDLVDLTQETAANLEVVAATPSSALGSTRDKPDPPIARRFSRSCTRTRSSTSSTSAATIPPTRCASSPRGAEGRLRAALHPHPEDHRQRPGRHRPHARLPVGGALRRAGLRRRQSRQPALPGVYVAVVMGRHAGFLTAAAALGEKFARRRPAPDLPARAHLRPRQFLADVKATYAQVRPLHRRRLRGHPRRHRRGDRQQAVEGSRERRARQRAALRHRRAGRPAVRRGQGEARHQARARRHVRLPAALVRRLRLRRRPARGARGRREGGAVRHVGRAATARSPSAAPATTRSTTR